MEEERQLNNNSDNIPYVHSLPKLFRVRIFYPTNERANICTEHASQKAAGKQTGLEFLDLARLFPRENLRANAVRGQSGAASDL